MYRILHQGRIFQLNLNLIVNFWIRGYKTYLFCCNANGDDKMIAMVQIILVGGKVRASAASLAKGTCGATTGEQLLWSIYCGATTVRQLLLKLNTCSRPIYQYDRVSQKECSWTPPHRSHMTSLMTSDAHLTFCLWPIRCC